MVGGGPAGLTAGLYAARARLRVVVLEKELPGGQIATTSEVENYPGFDSIAGPDLAARFQQQAEHQGARLVMAEVTALRLGFREDGAPPHHTVVTVGGEFRAPAVIVASGSSPRRLGVPGEDRLRGRGVSYCATCDGPFFADREVVVVGGGDSAFQEALFLLRFCRKVTVVHRRESFRAQPVLVERARGSDRVRFVTGAVVEEVLGSEAVEAVRLRDVATGRQWELACAGVFLFIGHEPNTGFLPPEVLKDAEGRVLAGEDTRTSVPGVFAAGDVRPKGLRQLTTAVADGSTAAMAAEHHLTGFTTLSY